MTWDGNPWGFGTNRCCKSVIYLPDWERKKRIVLLIESTSPCFQRFFLFSPYLGTMNPFGIICLFISKKHHIELIWFCFSCPILFQPSFRQRWSKLILYSKNADPLSTRNSSPEEFLLGIGFSSQLAGITNKMICPKNPWTLQWKGLNLDSRGPGPQNSHFWGVRILRVVDLCNLNLTYPPWN